MLLFCSRTFKKLPITVFIIYINVLALCTQAGYISRNDIAAAQVLLASDKSDISALMSTLTIEESNDAVATSDRSDISPEVCAALLIVSDDHSDILEAIKRKAKSRLEEDVLLALYYGFNKDDATTEQTDEKLLKKLNELQNKLLPEYVCIDGINVSFGSYLWRDYMPGSRRKYAGEVPADGGSALMGAIKLHAHGYIEGENIIPLPTDIMDDLEALWAIVIYQGDSWTARDFGAPSRTEYVNKEKNHFNNWWSDRPGFTPYDISAQDEGRVCQTSFYWKDCSTDDHVWIGPFYGPTEHELVPGDGRGMKILYNTKQLATIIFRFKHAGKEYTVMTSKHIINRTA